ncbi:hypothetical protein SLEP1_g46665 [Rubroshorea leprosula]|uniref:Uncharacterized protein n=1 Tax=Rubroshorea leprosula TaxID=152421 RepID=A0AAV5LNP2_9ROSI|nr:hypothetical protein SLEP1_g46665 [Rubroshorea leprosula]
MEKQLHQEKFDDSVLLEVLNFDPLRGCSPAKPITAVVKQILIFLEDLTLF